LFPYTTLFRSTLSAVTLLGAYGIPLEEIGLLISSRKAFCRSGRLRGFITIARLWAMAALVFAALLLCQAAGEDNARPEDWKQRGLKLAMSGQLETAAAALTKACEPSPRNDEACYYLGRTWFTLGRYIEARESFGKALQT